MVSEKQKHQIIFNRQLTKQKQIRTHRCSQMCSDYALLAPQAVLNTNRF